MIEMNLLVVSDFLHTAEIASDPQTFDGAEEIFMLHDFEEIFERMSAKSLRSWIVTLNKYCFL